MIYCHDIDIMYFDTLNYSQNMSILNKVLDCSFVL